MHIRTLQIQAAARNAVRHMWVRGITSYVSELWLHGIYRVNDSKIRIIWNISRHWTPHFPLSFQTNPSATFFSSFFFFFFSFSLHSNSLRRSSEKDPNRRQTVMAVRAQFENSNECVIFSENRYFPTTHYSPLLTRCQSLELVCLRLSQMHTP